MSAESDDSDAVAEETADESGEDEEHGDSSSETEEEIVISFTTYQLFVFLTCFATYGLLLYNRSAFTFTLPYILQEHYYTSYEVGIIVSTQTLAYTISKFVCSWASDLYPPKFMLAISLFFTGLVILALPDHEGWINIACLTTINGVGQGMGQPAVTKMIRAWFPPTQFGFWFAALSAAVNLMNTLGPSIASTISIAYGWRMAFQLPALLTIVCAFAVPVFAIDKPSDVGYEDQLTLGGAVVGHWTDLLGSSFMRLLATIFVVMFVVKGSCQSWGREYLFHERLVPTYIASGYLPAMEVGGVIGCLTLGLITDRMIRQGAFFGTGRSPRMFIVQLCLAGECLCLNLFVFSIEPDSSRTYLALLGFFMGYTMYGAISLTATVANEVAPIHLTGTAHAIMGLAANLGTVLSGSPVKAMADGSEWFTAFQVINTLCFVSFSILIIGKDVKATFLEEVNSGPRKLRYASTNGATK